ncbi:helix-turn-helix domain-containing protein [Pseudobutyrivibrio xylanivorans]|uniref:Transcriptional regulator, contains XRE-family HTH domain n=1 Tax=Pseudobutyrivibrio xylanivorans DSM 14809 TaxID=1123012 RepID=A0A1M6GJJ3_PSEXY|nr:helix-turn-helix transcriptional regulator [Pseudobutyrivibrio xylanivorans]SHJ10091.1 Transcriptional regulator, contains XRE-family HTH domain [Pseudobutyrivibrio xylanivorans DSM 14809]
MELGKRIKDLRSAHNWNQDELAEKMFVSRQTISNWENEKSYPDIQSILLLSNIFEISLDQLVKGDVEQMQEIINDQDVKQMKFYGKMMLACIGILIVTFGPLYLLIGMWSLIPEGILAMLELYFSKKLNIIEKENDLVTYKEIVTFMNGNSLDEKSKQQEIGKRPYQTVLVMITAGLISGILSFTVVYICKHVIGL